jgi:hypothetical protein
MNGLTHRNRSGNQRQTLMTDRPRRWRAWARAIAGTLPVGGRRITRRCAPLKLALRRSRALAWIVQRNTLVRPSARNNWVVMKPVLRLSLQWTRAANLSRGLQPATRGKTTPALPESSPGGIPVAAADLIHRWTFGKQITHSRTLLREIVERTRRLEDRIRVEKRMVARGVTATAVVREQQDAAHRAGPDWWKSESPMRSARAAPSPAINVDEIAETVMQRIDHRIRAWRERMGRM